MKRGNSPETTARKKMRMLEALKNQLGIVSAAVKIVGISGRTHYNWLNNDPKYKQEVLDLENHTYDFVENALLQRIKAGDTKAITFYLEKKLHNNPRYLDRRFIKTEVSLREDSAKKMEEIYYEITNSDDDSEGDSDSDAEEEEC